MTPQRASASPSAYHITCPATGLAASPTNTALYINSGTKNSSSCKRDTTTKGVRSQVGRATTTCGRQLAHSRITNVQVLDLDIRLWRCLPLTRTRCKLLICGFVTRWALTGPCASAPSAKRRWGRHNHLDERDTAESITAYREGATAVSLTAAHGLSLKSVKRLPTALMCRSSASVGSR